MTFDWNPATRATKIAPPSINHVLYFFDGPKMVLAIDARERQVLGVAADEDDDGTTRWVFAPAPPDKVKEIVATGVGVDVAG